MSPNIFLYILFFQCGTYSTSHSKRNDYFNLFKGKVLLLSPGLFSLKENLAADVSELTKIRVDT